MKTRLSFGWLLLVLVSGCKQTEQELLSTAQEEKMIEITHKIECSVELCRESYSQRFSHHEGSAVATPSVPINWNSLSVSGTKYYLCMKHDRVFNKCVDAMLIKLGITNASRNRP